MDDKIAKEISDRVVRASQLCETALGMVKAHESLGHVQIFGRLVGDYMTYSFTNVLAPIWKKFPTLEPEEMRIPYVEPDPALTPESARAMERFVLEARAALEYIESTMDREEIAKHFSYGGIPELAAATKAIEDFLKHPRFRDP